MPQFVPSQALFSGVDVSPSESDVDIMCVPVFQDSPMSPDLKYLDDSTGGEWSRATQAGGFRGQAYELLGARVVSGWQARRILWMGLGLRTDLTPERLRRAAAAAGYHARRRGAQSMGVVLRGGLQVGDVAHIADGLSAAELDLGAYKTGEGRQRPFPSRIEIMAPSADPQALDAAVYRGRVVGESVNLVRALTQEPPNVLTTTEFASRILTIAGECGLAAEILDEAALADLGMRLLLSVGAGSDHPPRLAVLRYEPEGAPGAPVIGFVGKGVTFDTGGVSIKPAADMDRMKGDMAGAASVLAAMRALALLGGPVRAIGVIPIAENMLNGRAMRPGDVVVGASGKSVEILNTDAEGRLMLADGLWHARQVGATHLVDIATLTGAMSIALGKTVTGLFGTPDSWTDQVRQASARAGERVWPMPIYEEAHDQLRSEIADLVNVGGRPGGASTAAAFLQAFAGSGPWAHLDIAGTSWAETKTAYQPKGPTGAGVRTLIEIGMTDWASRPE